MSDEQFQVESRFNRIDKHLSAHDARFDRIDDHLAAVDERFAAIDARFDRVDERFAAVDARFDRVETRFDDLGRDMRALYEDLKGEIRALAPDFAPIRREFTAADNQLREDFDRRVQPLEVLARSQSKNQAPAKAPRHAEDPVSAKERRLARGRRRKV